VAAIVFAIGERLQASRLNFVHFVRNVVATVLPLICGSAAYWALRRPQPSSEDKRPGLFPVTHDKRPSSASRPQEGSAAHRLNIFISIYHNRRPSTSPLSRPFSCGRPGAIRRRATSSASCGRKPLSVVGARRRRLYSRHTPCAETAHGVSGLHSCNSSSAVRPFGQRQRDSATFAVHQGPCRRFCRLPTTVVHQGAGCSGFRCRANSPFPSPRGKDCL
jgi:hypothetical protein